MAPVGGDYSRVKMTPPHGRSFVDLDVFGQGVLWRHLHVRRPVVPRAHSCVRVTWYLVLLFPHIAPLNWAQWRGIRSLRLEMEPGGLLMFGCFTRTGVFSENVTMVTCSLFLSRSWQSARVVVSGSMRLAKGNICMLLPSFSASL